jgi:Rrf2 family protein
MLAFTKKIEYALIALSHLAREGNTLCSAREIADKYSVPLPLLMNILKALTQRGLVRSIRGARGGYELAMPPEDMTVEALVLALEGPVALTQCVAEDEGAPRGTCELMGLCPVRSSVHKINYKLRQVLSEVTLADLVKEENMLPAPASIAADA